VKSQIYPQSTQSGGHETVYNRSRLLICVHIILTILLSICFLFYLIMNYFMFNITKRLVTMTNLIKGLKKNTMEISLNTPTLKCISITIIKNDKEQTNHS
jgi:hypothetical protein